MVRALSNQLASPLLALPLTLAGVLGVGLGVFGPLEENRYSINSPIVFRIQS